MATIGDSQRMIDKHERPINGHKIKIGSNERQASDLSPASKYSFSEF